MPGQIVHALLKMLKKPARQSRNLAVSDRNMIVKPYRDVSTTFFMLSGEGLLIRQHFVYFWLLRLAVIVGTDIAIEVSSAGLTPGLETFFKGG